MHDIRLIRDNPDGFDAGLARRGLTPRAAELIAMDEKRRAAISESQSALQRRNEMSKAIGALMGQGKKDEAEAAKAEVSALKDRIASLEADAETHQAALDDELATIPNLPLADVPQGKDEDDNKVQATIGEQPVFAFEAQEHDAIGPALGLDFETGVKLAGARFTLLRGPTARLYRALGQFMLTTLSREFGYEQVVPPLLVRDEVMFGTGQLPKFEDDLFKTLMTFDSEALKRQINASIEKLDTKDLPDDAIEKVKLDTFREIETIFKGRPENRRWLIPTAEVSLTNIVRESILSEEELPLRFTALTPCFRSEAGAAGRDTRGFIRQHQFDKAEMVSITTPEQSEEEHERMTGAAEHILTALGLPFRRMKLCTGDMGFSAARTYDLEVWLPGQKRYREISSCSTCTDFQARRMNARYRPKDEKQTRFVHTLNGSGLAVGRTLVAVLENYQQADGTVAIPDVLAPWMDGLNRIEPAN